MENLDARMARSMTGEAESGGDQARIGRSLVAEVNGKDIRYPLFRERITIGRTAGNDIQLKTPFVSRFHAAIINEPDRVHVVDLGSKNGIYVNGERTPRADLSPGDRLVIGDSRFLYQETTREPDADS
jgi:pSer/pThr/pTyr-binding forkhead associated (FHA) protein